MTKQKTPLSAIMDARDLTQMDVARALNVSRQAVQKWEAGMPITVANLKRLASFLNVSVSVLTGDGMGETPAGAILPSQSPEDAPDGYTRIPIYSIHAGCGEKGSSQIAELITGFVCVADWFLRTLAGVTSIKNLTILPSTGDSMEPTIANHSLVIIDKNQCQINRDGIYCIRADEQLLIKRVQRNIDRSLTLISDNKAYESIRVDADTLERTEIIGRVVYSFNGRIL